MLSLTGGNMSLRKYDDWDEALDEANNNSIKQNNVTPPDYNYNASISINMNSVEDRAKERLLTINLAKRIKLSDL